MKLEKMFPLLWLASLVVSGCAGLEKSQDRSPATDIHPIICNIKNYGAVGNGQVETAFIQAAVDACKAKGGIVVVPAGSFISGTIRLGGDMTFHLDAGAALIAAKDPNAFPVLSPPTTNSQLLNCRRALLYAEAADHLTIEGPGAVDGSGDFAPWADVKEALRPMAIFAVQGRGLKIQKLQVLRAAMWAVVLMETQGAHLSELDIDSQIGATRDGIDIVDGSDIHLDQITVASEDDSICLKSGVDAGLKHVWITNSRINGSLVANGLKFGTASRGPLQDIHFENITIQNVAQAAMALESVDGSQIEGVTFKNIHYRETGTGIFVLLGWRGDQGQAKPGSISNITFTGIDGESSKQTWGSALSGTVIHGVTYSPDQIQFKGVKMRFKGSDRFVAGHTPTTPPEYQGQYPDPQMWSSLPSEGLYFRHVKNITLTNTQLLRFPSRDARPILIPDTGKVLFDAP